MKETILSLGAAFGALAVLFGALGAHALKKIWSDDLLKSFETAVKYQMYHALLLLLLGFTFDFHSQFEQTIGIFISLGTLLFSFSIYGLCLSSSKGRKWRFLGPVTPLGGLLLLIGWVLLFYHFIWNM